MAEARIDKWLWASRIFKTRTIAAEACKKGRVSINGTQVKPSRMIKPGEVIQGAVLAKAESSLNLSNTWFCLPTRSVTYLLRLRLLSAFARTAPDKLKAYYTKTL